MKNILIILTLVFCVSCSDNKTGDKITNETPSTFNAIKSNTRMDTINTDKFWQLIDNAVKVSNGDDNLKEQNLTTELAKLSLDEITDFEFAFRKCVIDADDFRVMAAMKIIEGSVTDDSYLYFRCWLIGQGKTIYQETLKNPDYLANIVKSDKIHEFEELMYVATKAYEEKTGKKEGNNFPRDLAFKAGLDYDFGAPPTKGTDWTEDDLPIILPVLYKKLK